MDIDLVVVCGRVAAEPEQRTFDSGSKMMRLLVTVRSEEPVRRIDVIPVTVWDPAEDLWDRPPTVGDRVWISGAVQRRFWDDTSGRRSRLDVVAHHVNRIEAGSNHEKVG